MRAAVLSATLDVLAERGFEGLELPEVARARDRFFAAHLEEARSIVERAVARSELPPGAEPHVLVELVIGPALLRTLFMGLDLGPPAARAIVARAEAALRVQGGPPPSVEPPHP